MLVLELLYRHLDLTQKEVSRRTRGRVSQEDLSRLKRGLRPRPDQVRALGRAFGLTADEAEWLFRPVTDALGVVAPRPEQSPSVPPANLVALVAGVRR